MLYFSEKLTSPEYAVDLPALTAALQKAGVPFRLLPGASSIWMRDFTPVRTQSGRWVSFRYEPSYHETEEEIKKRTDFKAQIAPQLKLAVTYSNINLDGGNVVFSPSRKTVLISDRVFPENPDISKPLLVRTLEKLLEARVVIIPSLESDLTGHADGMVRFLDEDTVLGNRTDTENGLEQRIKEVLRRHGIEVQDFPFYSVGGISAEGCYLNFLETERALFLPVFGSPMDREALKAARSLFKKEVVPVRLSKVAEDGGCLNCISWEDC